jgi:hypothetical protein
MHRIDDEAIAALAHLLGDQPGRVWEREKANPHIIGRFYKINFP